jgi:hypothetical protein
VNRGFCLIWSILLYLYEFQGSPSSEPSLDGVIIWKMFCMDHQESPFEGSLILPTRYIFHLNVLFNWYVYYCIIWRIWIKTHLEEAETRIVHFLVLGFPGPIFIAPKITHQSCQIHAWSAHWFTLMQTLMTFRFEAPSLRSKF